MDSSACDGCGRVLEPAQRRFVVEIQVYAPYDILVVDEQVLAEDHAARLMELTRQLKDLDPEQALDDVARCFRYTLCAGCQRLYLLDPLRPPWL
jgi:hypothetical protein